MKRSYQNAEVTLRKLVRFIPVFLCFFLLTVRPLALAQTSQPSSQPLPPKPIREKGYQLTKNWDFGVNIRNKSELRREFHTRYIYSNGKLDHLHDEWQRYRDNGNHIFLDGGLALVARVLGSLRNGGIESGMLRSKWTGRYGYFEIRMKVPAGRGLWPAFWLNPEDQRWPPEIDVVEIVNNGRDTTRESFHFLHGISAKNARVNFTRLDRWGAYRPGCDYEDGFHIFGVKWTKKAVRHYVDSVLVVDRAFEWKHDDGTDGGPAHVLVNLAVGGRWPGPPVDAKAFPAKLEIDYIRVWQRR